jgi:hypothetical protein
MKSIGLATAASILTIFALAPSSPGIAASASMGRATSAVEIPSKLPPSSGFGQPDREMLAQQDSPKANESQEDSSDASNPDDSANNDTSGGDDQSNGDAAQNGDSDTNSDATNSDADPTPDAGDNGDNSDQGNGDSADQGGASQNAFSPSGSFGAVIR